MVKVRPAEESALNELRDALQDLQRLLTPTSERFATVDDTLRKQLLRLSSVDPEVRISVIGAPGSGKSTLVNALIGLDVIPEGTERILEVLPFVSPTPMLRRRQGKAVAAGEEGCRAHLLSEKETWVEELGDRRLHAPLPLIAGPHCCQNNWCLLDCPSSVAALQPKLSSVATRIRTPNIYSADFFFFCVNSTWLGTTKENDVLWPWIGDVTDVQQPAKKRLLEHTVFVLTFADSVPEDEKSVESSEVRSSIASLVKRFKQLFFTATGGLEIEDRRIVCFSGRSAFHTKRLLMFEPSITEMYNYCELVFGAMFMQTIDEMEESALRHMIRKFATEKMMIKSGAQRVTDLVRLFDYNCSIYLMHCACSTATDCVEQLQHAFQSAKPAIAKEVDGLRGELDVLVQQRTWIVTGLDEVTSFVETKMTEDLVYVVQQQLSSFFAKRLEELRFVLEGRELVWFKSHQTSTVAEMQLALRKLERFTATYVQQRAFLESKLEKGAKSVGGWEFLDENTTALLAAMQAEQQELVCSFCRRVSHHVKDEFDRCIGDVMQCVSDKKNALLGQFLAMVNPMLEQAEMRLQRGCDIDTAVNVAAETKLLEKNERRINNFLRELPDHVASAAVEIANQWFVPPSVSATPSSVPCSAATDDDGGHRIDHNLLYLLEAWRLTFSSIEPYQLCKYNIHEATHALHALHGQAAEFLVAFVEELDRGIGAVKDQIVEIEADGCELEQVEQNVGPISARLSRIAARLRDSVEWSVDVAAQRAVEEQEAES
jgi:energy-coupling factor transporter ATP-binding protein EcfA2